MLHTESVLALPDSLRAQLASWLEQASDASDASDEVSARPLARAVAQSLLPAFHAHGMVRLDLVDDPARYRIERLERLLLLVSHEIGFVLPQSYSEGELAHVQDDHQDYTLPATRGHQTSQALAFHSDRCDVNLLLYVRTAAVGGQLSVVSYQDAAALLGAREAAALRMLYEGFPVDLREERIFPSLKWHWRTILWEHQGSIQGHYIRRFISDSQRHADCPRLTPRQLAALDQWDGILDDMRAGHTFASRPGELLMLDNYRVMHARAAYADAAQPQAKRLALRTWVAPYASAPLPVALHALAGSCAAGSFRGGVGQGELYLQRLGSTSPI